MKRAAAFILVFLGCCCRPRCRRTRHCEVGSARRRRFCALPCDC
jgi:hypothetical protein